MNRDLLWLIAALVALVGTAYLLWPDDDAPVATRSPSPDPELLQPRRPSRPPVPGRDIPTPPPEPVKPPVDRAALTRLYHDAVAAGEPRPGELAFRSTVDAFVDYNMAFAEAQAEQEGITIDEVRELTHFGFLVLQSQKWPEVEDLLGRPLTEDERHAGETLMHEANAEFKDAMRKLVRDGSDLAARQKLIQDTQERYRQDYFALTGMTPQLLDDLLAGDATRSYAPSTTPPPEDLPPGPAYTPPGPRPRAP